MAQTVGAMKTVSENACFGGVQGVYSHASDVCGCEMTFAVYLPPQAKHGKVPVLWYLSGLTCTHENAMTKAGAEGWAAAEGIAVVFPDTSPRGEGVAARDPYRPGICSRVVHPGGIALCSAADVQVPVATERRAD